MFFALCSLFLFVYIFFDNSLGFSETSAWWSHITYNFQHAGIIHLLLNAFCFSQFYKIFKKIFGKKKSWLFVLGSLFSAIAASFLPFCIKPIATIGASGVIYAMIGIYFELVIIKVVKVHKKNFFIWLSCLVIALTISYFNRRSAFELHLSCLCVGIMITSMYFYFRLKIRLCKMHKKINRYIASITKKAAGN